MSGTPLHLPWSYPRETAISFCGMGCQISKSKQLHYKLGTSMDSRTKNLFFLRHFPQTVCYLLEGNCKHTPLVVFVLAGHSSPWEVCMLELQSKGKAGISSCKDGGCNRCRVWRDRLSRNPCLSFSDQWNSSSSCCPDSISHLGTYSD